MEGDKLLKSLPVHSFEDGIVWFKVDLFLDHMKSHRVEGDDRRIYQMIDSFSKKTQYLKIVEKLISLQGIVTFCLDKQARHSVCKRIACEIMFYLNNAVLNFTTSEPKNPRKLQPLYIQR